MSNTFEQIKEKLTKYNPSEDVVDFLRISSFFVITSATSSGKSSIANRLIKTGRYGSVITDTTRRKRINDGVLEENGQHYWFISKEEFLMNLKAGRYIEAAVVHNDHLYGSSIEELKNVTDKGKIAILDIDIVGCENIKKIQPNTKTIFILPPDLNEWMLRLEHRGVMSNEEKTRRLKSAKAEITEALSLPYITFFVNDVLDNVVQKIDDFISTDYLENLEQDQARQVAQKLLLELEKNIS